VDVIADGAVPEADTGPGGDVLLGVQDVVHPGDWKFVLFLNVFFYLIKID
jgi:hypothetical protein